ncbi:sensor histidine kinase [Dyella tabacisoli]|uniref:histidine kinase n=2 Tax=Dyella tabacisoli TaxID=2282381 RepID=A0A369ULX3_9GAMM|nr:sensor histidine kinase [Dyella tabacisoli]
MIVGLLWMSGSMMTLESEDDVFNALREAVTRDADGGLSLRPTSALNRLRTDVPDLWFVVRDDHGHVVSEGSVPPEYARIGDALNAIGQGRLGWNMGDPARPTAQVRRILTPAGTVHAMTGPGGQVPLWRVLVSTMLVLVAFIFPAILLMALATLVATPIVVRRTMKGLDQAAADAGRIDVEQRGVRLATTDVPTEAMPLVDAVNAALGRLDEGYARQQRFLMDAAHELRTPIAILQTRLEGAVANPENARLLEDVARLANLAEQMLDLQRLDQQAITFASVDLVATVQRVAADLAPLVIAAGYTIAFEADTAQILLQADRSALERALANLVQNAIQHGGRRGTISLRVHSDRTIEVADEGGGVAPDHRERIFEPFHRVQPLDRGVGLGLHLVREIVRRHGGRISVHDEPLGGACFRLSFPIAAPVARFS